MSARYPRAPPLRPWEATINEIEKTSSRDLEPYERGLPFPDALKGALTRFLPGSVVGLTGMLAWGGWPGNVLASVPGYLVLVAIATLGFGLGLSTPMQTWTVAEVSWQASWLDPYGSPPSSHP